MKPSGTILFGHLPLFGRIKNKGKTQRKMEIIIRFTQ